MRKTLIALCSSFALVAFMGMSAPAFALTDPSCDGDPYNNDPVIHEFVVDTPDSHKAHDVSSVVGDGVACGSDIRFYNQGAETLYNHLDIGIPPGVVVSDSDSVPEGSYVSKAKVNILYFIIGVPVRMTNQNSKIWTRNKNQCISERDNRVKGDTPQGQIVGCWYGEAGILGKNWNWITRDSNDKLWLTIGPMLGIGDIEPIGLTRIHMEICDYYGDVNGDSCGTSGQFVQKNGDKSAPNCANGNGIYTAVATMESTFRTPEVSSCVEWSPPAPENQPRLSGPPTKKDQSSTKKCRWRNGKPKCN